MDSSCLTAIQGIISNPFCVVRRPGYTEVIRRSIRSKLLLATPRASKILYRINFDDEMRNHQRSHLEKVSYFYESVTLFSNRVYLKRNSNFDRNSLLNQLSKNGQIPIVFWISAFRTGHMLAYQVNLSASNLFLIFTVSS